MTEESGAPAPSRIREMSGDPVRRDGSGPLVYVATEFYLGGLRFAAGTYKITRLDIQPTDDPAF